MLLTYQYRLQPNSEQVATLSHWGELLRRHWNYALGERLDYLRRTRSSLYRCSLVKDFHYSVAHYLCANYDLIGFEKLNIKGLARTRLAKSILDVAWRSFLNILQAVAVRRGKHIQEVDARGTSIECFNCEKRVVKDLSVRVHNCPNCGVSLDRDYNAAINVLKRTTGLSFAACGDLGVAQSLKQEISFVSLRELPSERTRLTVGVVTKSSVTF
jgi:putative transposase